MNNEIGRKITSLTLMTIMLAGGMSFAAPSMMPAAFAANANLFVSAENSQFDNYMSGPQVIEVVVIDSDINDTDQGKGEPDVTVNGKKLRMAQAVDGNWYGYFADKPRALIADDTVGDTEGEGLDFGAICTAAEAEAATDVNFADTVGVALQRLNANCGADAADAGILHVVREAKQLNTNAPTNGQIGIDEVNEWPFIQLYTLSVGGNVVVQYNKGGGAQSVTLTYDTVDQYASSSLDRAVYPQGAQVHATITDLWLNIDPTDEDSWTFGTVGTHSTNYQVFDENGLQDGDVDSNTDTNTLTSRLSELMCEDNCVLKFNPDVQGKGIVGTLQDNDDSAIIPTTGSDDPTVFSTANGKLAGFVPVTITEQGPNSGVFGTYDESDTSNIIITSTAKRGTSASIDYNETPVTILVGHSFAKVDIKPTDDEWNSGEEIPVTLVDGDANINSRADEDLDVNNPNVKLIPALSTGDPFTLGEKGTESSTKLKAVYFNNADSVTHNNAVTLPLGNSQNAGVTVQKFSERAILNTMPGEAVDSLAFDYRTTAEDLQDTVLDRNDLKGFSLFNLDVRSLSATGPFNVYLLSNTGGNVINDNGQMNAGTFAYLIASGANAQSLNRLADASIDYIQTLPANADVGLAIVATTGAPANAKDAVVADFFSFGYLNDGLEADERIANQLIRLELEETGDNTSTFTGTLEYVMINQLNILDPTTYTTLSTIADDPNFIVIEDLDDEESPRINYNDLGQDGVVTQVSDQEEAPSHSGVVSLDQSSYKNADTVTITLEDLDLNVDSDLIDIYTTVFIPSGDANNDVVGSATQTNGGTSVTFSDGDHLGRLLDVTFDDLQWKTPTVGSACSNALLAITSDTGLAATGFTLIETGAETGIFVGSFQIPGAWCSSDTASAVSVTGLDIEVNYVDFRDASGEIIEVGDSAGVRATTGSVSLDRTVYPVPFGVPDRFASTTSTTPDGRSVFPIHQTGINTAGTARSPAGLQLGEYLEKGGLTVHIRVNDPDFDTSASGEDKIAQNRADLPVGPVKISVIRGASEVVLGYAGGPSIVGGHIDVGDTLVGDGKIALNELTIPANNNGFVSGETINIVQAGVTTQATALFTNGAVGQVQANELVISNNVNGQPSPLNITIQDDVNPPVPAIFVDLNGDTNVDTNEISSIGTGTLNNGAVTIRDPANVVIANAVFTDDVDTIDNGELTINAPPAGAGYVSGQVTLVGVTSTASVSATFTDSPTAREFGPMNEIAPDAGIFEADILIRYTDGPASSTCPDTNDYVPTNGASAVGTNPFSDRFSKAPSIGDYCILQGDILQVEYTDPADASGDVNTVTDSATFDLRNGVLQSDKSVYIIGSDMILTLIEPDFDLDNDQAETYDLDLIEWDSDAATVTMGDADGEGAKFDPEPLNFRETGDSTGIFQIVIEIPKELQGDNLERGEEIVLEYTDWGPSGSDYVGDEDEDVNLTIFTSNFGATVELDQKVYTWTDKVYITIVAPDHNFDSNLVDEIGDTSKDPVKVSTRGFKLDHYKLVETGTDTGIFTGEVILTGFEHDADGIVGSDTNPRTLGSGPTDGFLQTDDDDGLTVSFEFSEDETIVGSALIRWNIGEVQWLEASYPASGTGVVRVIDPDMNLDPESVDNFDVDTWSDSDAGGIDLTVTETNEATGIFEGTVFFTTTDESSGHRLRVSEGDTVTASYEDNTLPNPYTTADELDITATSLIGTVVPPLERAPAANLRTVDAFGNSLDSVSVDQQVQITADLANGQDREQQFAYLVQIQDGNGVTVSLAWITGSLSAGQSFSPALSWIPTQAGTYSATAFVWESVDNPTALSPPVSTTITVR